MPSPCKAENIYDIPAQEADRIFDDLIYEMELCDILDVGNVYDQLRLHLEDRIVEVWNQNKIKED